MKNSDFILALDTEGLPEDDPHAPRHYGRDIHADDAKQYFCDEPFCRGHLYEDGKCRLKTD